ncbi:MAG: BamA/TamA family outer membrane protein [Candidatus Electryonea clarkiae]|nr:BamA/TamA family outer membrane protein [Candidatus Electryonea clarkiae]MDP8285775.1 BamA/TamA family outer membrane protein [Candidatus Electryonea clarkiae]
MRKIVSDFQQLFMLISSGFIILISFNQLTPAYSATQQSSSLDSIETWKKNNLKRPVLEVIGETTGDIVYLPFRLPLIGMRESIKIIDNTKIIQQINDLLESDDGTRKLAFIASPSTGLGGHYKQMKLVTDSTTISLKASAWAHRMQSYELSLTNMPIYRSIFVEPLISYQFLSTEPYFGLRDSSDYSYKSNFALEKSIGEINLVLYPVKSGYLKATGGMEVNHTFRGYDTDYEFEGDIESPWSPNLAPLNSLAGAGESVQMTHLAIEAGIDTKNHIGIPSAGYEINTSAGYYDQTNGDDYKFWLGTFNFTKYTHLIYKRVIVLRFGGELRDPLAGDNSIPFYHWSSLGGTGSLRGFDRDRFRDKDAMYGSLEYRYPLRNYWDKFGLDFLYFVDGGKVMEDFQVDYSEGSYQIGFGFGLRAWNIDSGETMKMEVGFSREVVKVYFVLGL